ncbi:MAG: glycosyltransferase family 4 protein [bacterium JZ-2024 1]
MKITFFTERLLPGLGADTFVSELANRLTESGHRVRVYAIHIHKMFTEETSVEIRQLAIPFSRRLPVYHRSTLKVIRTLITSGELVIDADEIVVLATEPFYPLAGLWRRSGILYFGNSPPTGLNWKARINYAYAVTSQVMRSLPAARIVMPCSYYLYRTLPRRIRDKMRVLYPGVDHYDRWSPPDSEVDEFRRSLGLNKDDALLFFAGRLNYHYQPYKGLKELISHYLALRSQGRRVRLLVAGYGDEHDASILADQGVIVFRNAERSLMPRLFKACDIYCTASRWEGFNLPLAEAQHFAKPVIAYDTGAHPEILFPADSGYLVQTTSAFRSTLEFMLDNRPWCREMGGRGRDHVARFRWKYTVRAFEKYLKEVFGGN